MSEKRIKETEIQGFLTGDYECGLICPMPLPQRHQFDSDAEWRQSREKFNTLSAEDGVYIGDLMPEAVKDGEYEFSITVEATPVSKENG